MAPLLYMTQASPPCRAVLLAAKALDVEFEIKKICIISGDHMKPEFIKINPKHTIPTMVDDDVVICDSHVIMSYLVGKYGPDDSLYPSDPIQRALVDERLHFDSSVLFPLFYECVKPLLKKTSKDVSNDVIEGIQQAYSVLEIYLESQPWVAGDSVTIADFSFITSVTAMSIFVPVSDDYPNITRWIERCEALPYYEVNIEGFEKLKEVVEHLMNDE